MAVFPLTKEIKANEKVSFTARQIVLKGSTIDESIFNDWISTFKTLNWISNFEITTLKKDKKDISVFELKITLKDV
ncbi:hypothetical protein [Flavobacterium sp. 3HN19-14]|uniref:hypothetical protein n=1 Tax=Flavobacterium sp. 3HN19-14 TaxID=3448133 RepID=UPI003EE0C90F